MTNADGFTQAAFRFCPGCQLIAFPIPFATARKVAEHLARAMIAPRFAQQNGLEF